MVVWSDWLRVRSSIEIGLVWPPSVPVFTVILDLNPVSPIWLVACIKFGYCDCNCICKAYGSLWLLKAWSFGYWFIRIADRDLEWFESSLLGDLTGAEGVAWSIYAELFCSSAPELWLSFGTCAIGFPIFELFMLSQDFLNVSICSFICSFRARYPFDYTRWLLGGGLPDL